MPSRERCVGFALQSQDERAALHTDGLARIDVREAQNAAAVIVVVWRDGQHEYETSRHLLLAGPPIIGPALTQRSRCAQGALNPIDCGIVAAGSVCQRGFNACEYEPYPREPLPRVGERLRLLGHDDEPVGVGETSEVRLLRMQDVDSDFARDEGEGFESVAEWRAAHE